MTTLDYKFIENRKTGYIISAVLIGASLLFLLVKGLNYGIDFKGGSVFHYRFENKVTETQIRELLKVPHLREKLGEVKVQQVLETNLGLDNEEGASGTAGPEKTGTETPVSSSRWKNGSEYIIHTEFAETREEDDVEGSIDKLLSTIPGGMEKLQTQKIGPTIGANLRIKAAWALFLGVMIILAYISVRFQAVFAVAAVVALVHDCTFVLGLFSFLQREVNVDILAAILTILGYSLNDTIVILDRIRENLRLKKKTMGYADIVNLSINQSLSRTINTSVTTLLPVLTLLLFGGAVIRGFALALLIGVVIGTYSSIFVVSPIVVYWYYRAHPGVARKEEAAKA